MSHLKLLLKAMLQSSYPNDNHAINRRTRLQDKLVLVHKCVTGKAPFTYVPARFRELNTENGLTAERIK